MVMKTETEVKQVVGKRRNKMRYLLHLTKIVVTTFNFFYFFILDHHSYHEHHSGKYI